MEFTFKDSKSEKLFKDVEKQELNNNIIEDDIIDTDFDFEKKEDIKQIDEKISIKIDISKDKNDKKENLSSLQLKRIESKQNAILEILEAFPTPKVSKIKLDNLKDNDIEKLKLNLELFNSKLIILSNTSENKHINNLLCILQKISEYLYSNSLNIFMQKSKTPIKDALAEIDYLGMGDSELNTLFDKTILILNDIDRLSQKNIFEQSYGYSNLMIDKGLVLNAVTLFNESIGLYITQSAKSQSEKISEYISLVGESNYSKFNSQAKDFFINIVIKDDKNANTVPMFLNHKVVKEIDIKIEKKFLNILRTWSNKGDDGVFKRYVYIIKRVRLIRNSLAHGNLDINFRELVKEVKELNDDFHYLAIKKNILKR
ncbi:MAG: hypothetical protein U9Q30_06830 [Campylobacterota bacterium]|nr:hypothetical protein [Campylobacterota bacterium]